MHSRVKHFYAACTNVLELTLYKLFKRLQTESRHDKKHRAWVEWGMDQYCQSRWKTNRAMHGTFVAVAGIHTHRFVSKFVTLRMLSVGFSAECNGHIMEV